MAEEQVGSKKDPVREWWLFTKIFTAFRLAYDPYKLVLAAGGILVMAFGWWLLAAVYFNFWSKPPLLPDYDKRYSVTAEDIATDKPVARAAFTAYKQALNEWNLFYKLAGSPPASMNQAIERGYVYGPGDVANSRKEFDQIEKEIQTIRAETNKRGRPVAPRTDDAKENWWLLVDGKMQINVTPGPGVDVNDFLKAYSKNVRADDLENGYSPDNQTVTVNKVPVKVAKKEQWEAFRDSLKGRTLEEVERDLSSRENPEVSRKALSLLFLQNREQAKPSGYLATWPWFEDRGDNPFLLVTGQVKTVTTEGIRNVPWARGEFFTWLLNDQVPVLLEPLFKFLAPVIYLFHPSAGWFVWLYLLGVVLVTLAVWAFFGGAITRLAAVQAARPNERYDISDAIRFTRKHYLEFLIAPLLPLAILAAIAFFGLGIPGLLVNVLPWGLGDIPGGILFILVLILGFIMALGIVGLVGYPLMYSTISTEGTDSFDALSRSYSYVFQAPWRYAWNCSVALLYGAVVIFFVGLLGSLTVYMGKWGITRMDVVESREPSYLYAWAPTSFGWRDLLLTGGPHTETARQFNTSGKLEPTKQVSSTYMDSFAGFPSNLSYLGTCLVTLWLYVLFLAVVGFGYSYFWCATTVIYLLMRRTVDDNELTTVSLDDIRPPVPYAPPSIPSSPTKPATPGSVSLTVVEAPATRTTAPPPPPAAHVEPVRAPAEVSKPTPPPAAVVVPPAQPASGGTSGNEAEAKRQNGDGEAK